jgi:DNA repair exonuclease SbcCD ATPase subunit
MLDSVTPFLNKRANKYLSKLTGGSVEVEFNTQDTLASGEKRDKFSVAVINENGDEDYKGNSTGERRRVDVAINMALQDLVLSRSNKSIDFICYDEVFDGLDGIGCELVIELLNDRVQECGSIAVITHNDNLKQLFTKSVMLEKRGGRTLITENSI